MILELVLPFTSIPLLMSIVNFLQYIANRNPHQPANRRRRRSARPGAIPGLNHGILHADLPPSRPLRTVSMPSRQLSISSPV